MSAKTLPACWWLIAPSLYNQSIAIFSYILPRRVSSLADHVLRDLRASKACDACPECKDAKSHAKQSRHFGSTKQEEKADNRDDYQSGSLET